jgi:hypothetical protein
MTGLHDEQIKAYLPGLFDRYIEAIWDGTRRMKTAVPLPLINQVRSCLWQNRIESYI